MPRERKRKITLLLPESTVQQIQGAVAEGTASSQGGLVHEAVTEYFAERQRQERRRAWGQAAQDPRFKADVQEVMRDFRYVDEEPLPE